MNFPSLLLALIAKPPQSLNDVVTGRALTGILVEENNLMLRFPEATIVVDLEKRTHRFQTVLATWLTLPGWLRIVRVIEDRNQVILEVTGMLFTARIAVRKSGNEWHIVFQGGRILASY